MDRMNYTRGAEDIIRGDTRMEPYPELTVGQILNLPLGTEMLVIDIAPFGTGVHQQIIPITEKFKDDLRSAERHENCDHSMDTEALEASLFPGSIFVLLMPENWEPSIEEMLNEKFTKRGIREGREGAPMYSEAGLKTRYSTDEWHDGAYEAYVTAYKRGSESRKGR